MPTHHSKEFLSWFNDWANRHSLNKATRRKLLKESEDIDGILFLAAVACSSDEVNKFVSSERQKSALQHAFAALNADDNAKVKTDTKPFGVKASSRVGSTVSNCEEHNSSIVPQRLHDSRAALNSKSEEKCDWSCGLCRLVRVKFCPDVSRSELKRMDSVYDCFECSRSFCQQNDLTKHICQVH